MGFRSSSRAIAAMSRLALLLVASALIATLGACSSDTPDPSGVPDPAGTPGVPVVGAAPPGAGPITGAIIAKLRETSPKAEGAGWLYTDGNVLKDDWIHDVPGCWGDADCGTAPGDPMPQGLENLLDDIENDIGNAERFVDISSQIEFPTFEFRDAIVRGIKKAYDKGNEPVIRILAGAWWGADLYPLDSGIEGALEFHKNVMDALGPEYASRVKIVAATTMTTSVTTMFAILSWNHGKVILVDGKTVILGGINWWGLDYVPPSTKTPMFDVDVRIEGPAAAQSALFMDTLWGFICQTRQAQVDKGKHPDVSLKHYMFVAFSPAMDNVCPDSFSKGHAPPEPTGEGVGILSLNKLGVGLELDEDGRAKPVKIPLTRPSKFGSDLPAPHWPKPGFGEPGVCFYNPFDLYNGSSYDPSYSYYEEWNPATVAVTEFVSLAKESIFLSQLGIVFDKCKKRFPMPWFDAKTTNAIMDKMLDGVDVYLVESSIGAEVGGGGTYSMQDEFTWTLEALSERIIARALLRGLTEEDARAAFCDHFHYAPLRYATWPDGSVVNEFPHAELHPQPPPAPDAKDPTWVKARSIEPGNHTKMWAIDRKAFIVGSNNSIPWNLQEVSVMIENEAAVEKMYTEYFDVLWSYSRLAAYQDPESGGACLWLPPVPMSLPLPPLGVFPGLESVDTDPNDDVDEDDGIVVPVLPGIPFNSAFEGLPCPGLPKGGWQDDCVLRHFNRAGACVTAAVCKDDAGEPAPVSWVIGCRAAENDDGTLTCID